MFEHLDDPNPPAATVDVREAVGARARRRQQQTLARRAAVVAVALVGGVVGVLASTGGTDRPADMQVADRPVGPEDGAVRCCGAVSGTVTAQGSPADGVKVALLHRDGRAKAATYTDAAGRYRFPDVEDASYLVHFIDEEWELRSEWFGDATRPSLAKPIRVRVGADVVADADLAPAPPQGIRGQTFVPVGWPIADVSVWVFLDGELLRGVRSDADGRFELVGLEAGSYDLLFWDDDRDRFTPEWYRDASSRDTSTRVEVRAGEFTELVVQLDP